MTIALCPFSNFQECRTDCNFYYEKLDGCLISNALIEQTKILGMHADRLEKIEQYLLDASNSLIDINCNNK
jgi:hypothetical protein